MLNVLRQQFQMMSMGQKKAVMAITIIICAAVLFMIGYSFDFLRLNFPFLSRTVTDHALEEDIKKMTPRNAFDIAFARAREWRSDAELSFLGAQTSSEAGRSDSWRMIFVSRHEKNKGFVVTIDNKVIVSVQETLYRGSAADFPVDIMSPDVAIKQVHEIRGYTNVPILGIEAVYGAAEKSWYWGVRTSKGVVTIEAKRN